MPGWRFMCAAKRACSVVSNVSRWRAGSFVTLCISHGSSCLLSGLADPRPRPDLAPRDDDRAPGPVRAIGTERFRCRDAPNRANLISEQLGQLVERVGARFAFEKDANGGRLTPGVRQTRC